MIDLKDKVILISKRMLKNGNESFDTYHESKDAWKIIANDCRYVLIECCEYV